MAATAGVPYKAFTHGGVFHADDVFGAALLRLVNPDVEIVRGSVVPQGFEGIVFDIGNGPYDHHRGGRTRDNGVPYAAFGLLWERFGTLLLCEEDAAAFDRQFVQPVDLADNGGEPCLVSQLVSDFNPVTPADESRYNDAFEDAVAWAMDVLTRRFQAMRRAREERGYVRERMDACDGVVLVLDRHVPWKDAVVGSTYVYAVFPSVRGGYNVQAVPIEAAGREVVAPFPQAWRGASAAELARLTGIDDLAFCHASGFLCVAGTLEGAIHAAKLSLNAQ